jgi:hypothetical protein
MRSLNVEEPSEREDVVQREMQVHADPGAVT